VSEEWATVQAASEVLGKIIKDNSEAREDLV
jgi:hypothetical protein